MNQRINAIVFSKDRPAQLSLFLESVNKNAPGVFDLNVIVSHTSEEFDKGYGKVIHNPEFSGAKFFFEESEIKEQIMRLLDVENKYSCFFLDDDLIYREVKLADISTQMELDDDIACFSLRLGENTTN